jgi:hypothetical protein
LFFLQFPNFVRTEKEYVMEAQAQLAERNRQVRISVEETCATVTFVCCKVSNPACSAFKRELSHLIEDNGVTKLVLDLAGISRFEAHFLNSLISLTLAAERHQKCVTVRCYGTGILQLPDISRRLNLVVDDAPAMSRFAV